MVEGCFLIDHSSLLVDLRFLHLMNMGKMGLVHVLGYSLHLSEFNYKVYELNLIQISL